MPIFIWRCNSPRRAAAAGVPPDLGLPLLEPHVEALAFGGREEVMAPYDPRGGSEIVHSGTFNANPVTAAAGLATLEEFDEPEELFEQVEDDEIEQLNEELQERVRELTARITARRKRHKGSDTAPENVDKSQDCIPSTVLINSRVSSNITGFRATERFTILSDSG
jgi:hypothetical protein